MKSHLGACSQYSSHPMPFIKGTSPRPLSRTDQSSSHAHAAALPALHHNTVTQTDSAQRKSLFLGYYLRGSSILRFTLVIVSKKNKMTLMEYAFAVMKSSFCFVAELFMSRRFRFSGQAIHCDWQSNFSYLKVQYRRRVRHRGTD